MRWIIKLRMPHTLPGWFTAALQGTIALGSLLALVQQQWMAAAASAGILVLSILPWLLSRRISVVIPPGFQMLAIAFIFAALFLGEVRGYYGRFWWWDIVLHTFSGFLLGLTGFLLIFVLSEEESVHLRMKPAFVAFFSFTFALAMGAVWEIFEFFMDSVFGLNMQKSGLPDTMSDLIVDALGALVMSVVGYRYLDRGSVSFVSACIDRFIADNPSLFEPHDHGPGSRSADDG